MVAGIADIVSVTGVAINDLKRLQLQQQLQMQQFLQQQQQQRK